MTENKWPVFAKGRILKQEMLEELRDYPADILSLLINELSDGIINGLGLKVEMDKLIVLPGLLKYKGKICRIKEPLSVIYENTGKETLFKLRISFSKTDPDFETARIEAKITEDFKLEENEWEIARYKLKPGAILRNDYCDMEDFTTEYNTLNIIHRKYAAKGKDSIAPQIMRYFTNELLRYKTANPHDIALYYQVQNSPLTISMEAIETYFHCRLGKEISGNDRKAVHQGLITAVAQAKKEQQTGTPNRRQAPKLIID